jgi:hypothetical protein
MIEGLRITRAEHHAADGNHALLIERLADNREGLVGVVLFLGGDEIRRVEVKLVNFTLGNERYDFNYVR